MRKNTLKKIYTNELPRDRAMNIKDAPHGHGPVNQSVIYNPVKTALGACKNIKHKLIFYISSLALIKNIPHLKDEVYMFQKLIL